MKKFRLFKLILLTLFFFKILLTPSFSENETPTIAIYDLEVENKYLEALNSNLKTLTSKQKFNLGKESIIRKKINNERNFQSIVSQAKADFTIKKTKEKAKEKEDAKKIVLDDEESSTTLETLEEFKKEKDYLSKIFPENEASIIAKINNEIVTSYDLIVEIKYLEALNPNLKNLSQEQKTKIAKESIIREKIKTNEILKYYKLEQDTTYLNKIIATSYNKLGLKNDIEFNNYLSKYDLTIDKIKRKFEIEATWNKLIFEKYKNQVEVDVNKIKKKLMKEESRLNKQEIFLLSEILFNAENKEKLDKKYKKILESIKEIGFKNTANIYSISDTAKFGGLVGWIQKNQMSEIVINELSKINVGEFTKAINVPGGLVIIKIDEKKVNELEIDFDLELKKMIQFEKNKQLRQFSSIYYKKIKNNIKINEN